MCSPIDVHGLHRHLATESDDFVLLDCRTHDELGRASIPGALHLPMDQVPHRMGELDSSRQYAVLCHHGVRSALVCRFMSGLGFERTLTVTGGIDAYARQIDPSIGTY